MRFNRRRTVARICAVVIAGAGLTACNDFLKVTNPGAIEEQNLSDTTYIPLMVNGVIGDFQGMVSIWAYYSGKFTDELRNHGVFSEEREIDKRRVLSEHGTMWFFMYTPLQRARFLADSVSSRIKVLEGDSAKKDLRLARTLSYGGYTYVMLADNLCQIPINLSAPFTPVQTYNMAAERFEEAITVATAAGTAAGAVTPSTTLSRAVVAGADSIRNFALVGAARAYLNAGNKTKAIEKAQQVSPNFVFWSYYGVTTARENLYLYGRLSTGSSGSTDASLSNTPFLGLNDPRVPHPAIAERVQDASNAFVPNAPSSYSTYSGTVTGADFTQSTSMRIASHLEAEYIIAEARGPTAATLAFVNTRRAVGTQPEVTFTGDALMGELRDQRSRDFFLDGHRLGDLRRYLSQGIDLFQKGAYPGTSSGETYGDQTCWPLPLQEINGNPNIPKP